MRPLLFLSALLVAGATTTTAYALEAGDTMQAWRTASDQERSDLLETLVGKDPSGKARISRCVTDTSKTPGHADLPIGEVAKACASAKGDDQPV